MTPEPSSGWQAPADDGGRTYDWSIASRSKATVITELPISPDQERRQRLVKYTIAMTIRVLCIFSCLFLHGWWLLLPAIGAIVLPYVAVVIANAGAPKPRGVVERPGAVVRVSPRDPEGGDGDRS